MNGNNKDIEFLTKEAHTEFAHTLEIMHLCLTNLYCNNHLHSKTRKRPYRDALKYCDKLRSCLDAIQSLDYNLNPTEKNPFDKSSQSYYTGSPMEECKKYLGVKAEGKKL